MSHWTEGLANVSRSVRDRLMNTARETGENFQALLVRYATERLMYRISRSDYRNRFVLKGAWLFYLWDIPRRTTRDVDFLGHGENSADDVEGLFRKIVRIEPDIDDGLKFDPGSVEAEQTQEEGAYPGVRIRVTARLGQARIPTRIDLGFGDALTDTPVATDLPVLLDLPPPHLRAYSAEMDAWGGMGLTMGRSREARGGGSTVPFRSRGSWRVSGHGSGSPLFRVHEDLTVRRRPHGERAARAVDPIRALRSPDQRGRRGDPGGLASRVASPGSERSPFIAPPPPVPAAKGAWTGTPPPGPRKSPRPPTGARRVRRRPTARPPPARRPGGGRSSPAPRATRR